jgi:hypothetical protein
LDCIKRNKEATPEYFEQWVANEVKDLSYKLNLNIDKYFGTAIWLVRAGHRANYLKLYRAGMRIFSRLFHINGNINYSVIELYEDYVLTMMELHNTELFEHMQTRLCSNIKKTPLNSQPQDVRHEEMNKQAQNMFPGKSLEELDLACCIVDDVMQLRKQSFADMGIKDRDDVKVVIPDYRLLVTKIRYAIRKAAYLSNPLEVSSPHSIDGTELHECLTEVFEVSQQRRKEDIMKVVRFNDFREGYSSGKGKIPIMKDDKLNKITEKEMEMQALVLMECIEDQDTKENCRLYFSSLNKNDIESKECFVNGLIDQNYEFATVTI